MPEIGEVARIVHFLRQHLAGKTLSKVTAQVDENVYGKVGCSAEAFEEAMTGKKVLDAKQQGKYFWIVMSSPPHPLMHFGMSGWIDMKCYDTKYFTPRRSEDVKAWPPKYWKFVLKSEEEPENETAFVDFRRFARIRLIDCAAENIRNVSPLMENGPDPVQDADILTKEWLKEKLRSKRVPVKALLLDQANISGIGNWVGDELLYDAKIHPEQYSNTLSDDQIAQLHKSIHYVCKLAVDTLADKSQFPDHWLFNHRWGKGKKDSPTTLPNGAKFVFMTVGGRTSCVVPSVQKKTGPVAGDIKKEAPDSDKTAVKAPNEKKRARKIKDEDEDEDEDLINGVADKEGVQNHSKGSKRAARYANRISPKRDRKGAQPKRTSSPLSKHKSSKHGSKEPNIASKRAKVEDRTVPSDRRRSARLSSQGT